MLADHRFLSRRSTKIKTLHRDYIKKIRAYRFDENELIDSDHVDFIGTFMRVLFTMSTIFG